MNNKVCIGRKIIIDPGIHHLEVNPVLPAKNIDSRSPLKKIVHHLPRYFLRIGTYPMVGNPVIGSEYDQMGINDLRVQASQYQPDLQGK